MKPRYSRKGTMILKDGAPYYFCLTFTGARFKLWKLRRGARADD